MLIFLLQARDLITGTAPFEIYLFGLFVLLVWIIWFVKVGLSSRYKPWTAEHKETVSVIIPVVDEPTDLFYEVLEKITAQGPEQVIVVINGPRNHPLELVCDDLHVSWFWTETAGKRNAIRLGLEHATQDIAVIVDSDTIWSEDTLAELVKPFIDLRVGGVTTKQRILDPNRSFFTRWADWLENSRALYSMPAQSVMGQVGCLPGRTIAIRRDLLVRILPDFLQGEFMGVFLEVSDDRTLTNLILKAQYRTVYQSTSLVYTDAPRHMKKLYKQQLRWARGSQYNTLRMLPWMLLHAPILAFFFVADIILPFLLAGAFFGGLLRTIFGNGYNYYSPILDHQGVVITIILIVLASWLSMVFRQMRHLYEKKSDTFLLPVYILFSSLFLMPIRLLGFFRMAHVAGWGTRAHAYKGEKKFNIWAGVPYIIGIGIFALEALAYV